MKDKEPFNVTNYLRVYNILQVFACTAFVTLSYAIGFDFRFLWKCESFDFFSDDKKFLVKIGTWFFLLLRIVEFLETIFFILRKKQSQASFLHIYHHISTVILMWVFISFDTGEISEKLKIFMNRNFSCFRTHCNLRRIDQLVHPHHHVLLLLFKLF